jgi:DeoR family transcriptional regulator, suf operon transcriptional repressor
VGSWNSRWWSYYHHGVASNPGAAEVPVTPLADLPPTRRAILEHLRVHGEARAEELALALSITPGGVRQQLAVLSAADLVVHRDVPGPGPGRPRRHWALAPAAEALFPRAYGELATQLLGYVEEEDPALLERAFARRARVRTDDARARLEACGDDLGARVRALAALLDEQGYLASCTQEEDGSHRIVEHNCAILAVARAHSHACSTELAVLRELLPGAEVTRVAHVLSGSHACVYEVRPTQP